MGIKGRVLRASRTARRRALAASSQQNSSSGGGRGAGWSFWALLVGRVARLEGFRCQGIFFRCAERLASCRTERSRFRV